MLTLGIESEGENETRMDCFAALFAQLVAARIASQWAQRTWRDGMCR